MNISETIIDYKKLLPEHQNQYLEQLLAFDVVIFPDTCKQELYDFMHDADAISVQVIEYFDGVQLIGYNSISILKLNISEKTIFVVNCRGSFLPNYQRGNKTLSSVIKIAVQHSIKHPLFPLWFVVTVMQPKAYALLASCAHNFYPRNDAKTPQDYLDVLKLIAVRKSDVQKRGEDIFVHPRVIPETTLGEAIQIHEQADQHIDFFMQHTPDYFDGMGMMCVSKLNTKMLTEAAILNAIERAAS
ncbi:hypothetical protein [Acinetobacter sp. GXMZU3951]